MTEGTEYVRIFPSEDCFSGVVDIAFPEARAGQRIWTKLMPLPTGGPHHTHVTLELKREERRSPSGDSPREAWFEILKMRTTVCKPAFPKGYRKGETSFR